MLTSLQNPLVKQMRKLHRPKERRSQQLFLLEGTHLLEAALAANCDLAVVCYTATWQAQHDTLCQQAIDRSQRSELVSSEVLAAIATTVHPDGVVAAAIRRAPLAPPAAPTLGVALETLQDPGNLGTLIRTAAAAGVDGMWLSADSVDVDHPKVLRASAGLWFRLPMIVSDDLLAEVCRQRTQGIQVIATLPAAEQIYWEVDLRKPTLLLLGNEGAGLSPALAAIADLQVRIPLALGAESLNVSIAAALILYEAQRQRKFTG
jgi:TrmH family RNA methyltransferase